MKKYVTILTAVFCLMFVFVLNTKAAVSKDYEYVVKNGTIEIRAYKGTAANVTVPSKIAGKTVTAIAGYDDATERSGAFYGSEIESVTIPGSVKTIGAEAFDTCRNLKSVKLQNGLKKIAASAFNYCPKLTKIVIPNSVTEMGRYAFSECSSLKSVTISNQLKTIPEGAFNSCGKLASITIPNGVKTIGEGAFAWCESLKSVTIAGSVTKIGENAFDYCRALNTLKMSEGVKTIDEDAFAGCINLKNVTIPKSVTTIGKHAIGYDWDFGETSARRYKLYSGIMLNGYTGTAAESYANNNIIPFTALDNPSPIAAPVGSIQMSKGSKYKVTTSDTVAYGRPASKSITRVSIPSKIVINGKTYKVTAIYNKAFANCNQLRAVIIPDTVRQIGKGAFYKCKRLRGIYVRTRLLTKATVGKAAFKKIHKKAKFYVPYARKKYYKKLFRKRGAPKKIKVKGF